MTGIVSTGLHLAEGQSTHPQLGRCVAKGVAASWVRTCDRRAAHIIRPAEADPAVQETYPCDPEQEQGGNSKYHR